MIIYKIGKYGLYAIIIGLIAFLLLPVEKKEAKHMIDKLINEKINTTKSLSLFNKCSNDLRNQMEEITNKNKEIKGYNLVKGMIDLDICLKF
jgi:hypothetical protein